MIEPELAKVRLATMTFMPALPLAMAMVFIPVAMVAFFLYGDIADSALAGLVALAGATPVFCVILIVCALTYDIRIYANGVSSYDPFGSWKRDFVAWEDMHEIHSVSAWGVTYCRIDGEQKGALWIPSRSFSDPDLLSAVQQNAPDSRLAGWMMRAS